MKISKLISLPLVVILSGCSSTDIQTTRAYQEIGRSEHFDLKESGYIVGFEKITKKNLKGLNGDNDEYTYNYTGLKGDSETIDKQNSKFKGVTENQEKVMLATQVTTKFSSTKFLFNSYKKNLNGDYDYNSTYEALNLLSKDLKNQLDSANDDGVPYSHILVMSMGWNNDQVDSLWRYNLITENLKAVDKEGKYYKPLIIGITWPSVWNSVSNSNFLKSIWHLSSYSNKANDADELGFTLVNYLINHEIPEAIRESKLEERPKLVVIGHSFGARIMSRAVFSKDYIKPIKGLQPESMVDLFIGLQGAFSANRFVSGKGKEGSPYADFTNMSTKFVLTTSKNDTANPIAAWLTGAKHVGGKYGLEVAQENTEDFLIYNWEVDQMDSIPLSQDKIVMVDANAIVNKDNDLNVSAHNDILDMDMAKLMWNFIEQI